MKIVVQTGDILGRSDIQWFIGSIPNSWIEPIDTFVVYSSQEESLKISFHKKEKVLGVHMPRNHVGQTNDVLEEVAIALQAIAEIGRIPDKLPKARREEYRNRWLEANL